MKYSDRERAQIILNYAEKLLSCMAGRHISREDLLKDYAVQWLVSTPVILIGEQAYKLSQGYKDDHPGIAWGAVADFRHWRFQDEDEIDWNVRAEVLFDDLPVLTEQIRALLLEERQA